VLKAPDGRRLNGLPGGWPAKESAAVFAGVPTNHVSYGARRHTASMQVGQVDATRSLTACDFMVGGTTGELSVLADGAEDRYSDIAQMSAWH
jgi:hypothetical protein